ICHDLKEITPNCDVHFEASAPLLLSPDQAIGLALVVTELVANAAKHAYPDGTRGQIWVRLTRADGQIARISVRDEGVGLPLNLETSKRVGLGMGLTSALVKQSDAKLRIERHAPGTEFVLDVPVKNE